MENQAPGKEAWDYSGLRDRIMNSLLIICLNVMNTFLALSIIILGAVAGSSGEFLTFFPLSGWLGAMVGGFMGLGIASLICGFLTLLLDIRHQLVQLVKLNGG